MATQPLRILGSAIAGLLMVGCFSVSDEAKEIERKITRLGILEKRIVATPSYDKTGVTFQLPGEKANLEQWLQKDDNRKRCLNDPKYIDRYNRLSKDEGGPLAEQNIKWYPRLLKGTPKDPTKFIFSYATLTTKVQSQLEKHIVQVFTQAEHDAGVRKEKPTLLEYVPVNMHEIYFCGGDMDAAYVRAGVDENGTPAVHYQMKAAIPDKYADWSEKYIGVESVIILDGYVKSAPFFMSRISGGRGQITGLTAKEANDLAEVLKRPATNR